MFHNDVVSKFENQGLNKALGKPFQTSSLTHTKAAMLDVGTSKWTNTELIFHTQSVLRASQVAQW